MARCAARRATEPLDVISRHGCLHHLNGTACEAELIPHQRSRPRPLNHHVKGRKYKATVAQSGIVVPKRTCWIWTGGEGHTLAFGCSHWVCSIGQDASEQTF